MRFFAVLLALLMIVGGVHFFISGYELSNSDYSKAENLISNLITGSSGRTAENANIRMILGGILALSGLITLIAALQKKKKENDQ